MIAKSNTNNQLPTEMQLIFKQLGVFKRLRNAGIKKFVGYPYSYILQLIFYLKKFYLLTAISVIHVSFDTLLMVWVASVSRKRRQLNVDLFRKRYMASFSGIPPVFLLLSI